MVMLIMRLNSDQEERLFTTLGILQSKVENIELAIADIKMDSKNHVCLSRFERLENIVFSSIGALIGLFAAAVFKLKEIVQFFRGI